MLDILERITVGEERKKISSFWRSSRAWSSSLLFARSEDRLPIRVDDVEILREEYEAHVRDKNVQVTPAAS